MAKIMKSYINSIEPSNFTNLMKMTSENKISSRGAKDLLVLMYKGDKREPLIIAEEKGLPTKERHRRARINGKGDHCKNPWGGGRL